MCEYLTQFIAGEFFMKIMTCYSILSFCVSCHTIKNAYFCAFQKGHLIFLKCYLIMIFYFCNITIF